MSRCSPLLSKCGQSPPSGARLERPPSGAAPVARCAPASTYLRPDRSTSSFASPLATRSLRVLRRTCGGFRTTYFMTLVFISLSSLACHPERDVICLGKDLSLRELDRAYHDDFATPGISPRRASPRKHSRHRPNLRR